jgi:flagellar assembly protein FliH
MTGFVPKEKLTAYQRWEVAAFDEAEQAAQRSANPRAAGAEGGERTAVTLATATEIERMHAEASAEGYAAGHAEGLAAARHSAARMDALLTSLQQAVREADQFVADRLLATAVEIANQVLRQSLRLNPELLLPVVREAVSTLNAHLGHPALFVRPDDAALIRAELGDQLANNNWRLIEDATLTAGGCRVELGASEVDATLETRWRRVIEAMGISQDWLADRNG